MRRKIFRFSRSLNRFLFGARIAHANDQITQLEAIIAAYAANLVLVLCLVYMLLVAGGLYQSLPEPFLSVLPRALAISNIVTFVLTFLASLTWMANSHLVRRAREFVSAQGSLHAFMGRYVVPVAMVLWGLLSLTLIALLFRTLELGLMHPLAIGSLAGSVGANALLFQMILMRRSLRV
ncbi:hypothetical protein [Bradyrhizobium roseum]|uniref:hypothetical protein n=1 Tax=Bradyrhizobium roseum TaxID=3056648 RepID=UPI00260D4DE4|nr:hypothetical protein [Bradyrhizobium roseus]WKA31301.1 hypothetical protein QUH67_14550 [Bradyrhizobium roseus]